MAEEQAQPAIAQVDLGTTRAHPARVYDYLLGGKDNYAADRAAAEAMITQLPSLPRMARENREFLGRAVRHLVSGLGVRQFLDIGSGIPTIANVHEVAQRIDPDRTRGLRRQRPDRPRPLTSPAHQRTRREDSVRRR